MKLDISKYYPCEDGLDYYDSKKTTLDAWTDCPRGDWMMFFAQRIGVDKRKLILASSLCAKTVEHFMEDERIIDCVNAGIKYGKGEIQEEELINYQKKAKAAVYNVGYTDTVYSVAYFVAFFASPVAFSVAFSNVWDASTLQKKQENQLETANIFREILTDEILKHLK